MDKSNMNETDGVEIDQLINDFFAVFDNRAGNQPKFESLDAMFIEGGMIYKCENYKVESMDLASFKTPREALFASGTLKEFHEWEVSHQTDIEGGLAARRSLYQKKGWLNNQVYQGQGTKHFQLIKTEAGWKITAISWEDLA